jgi:hypothetical protein
VAFTGQHGTGNLALHRCPAITCTCRTCGGPVRILTLDDSSVSSTTKVVLNDEPDDQRGTYVIGDEGKAIHDDGRQLDAVRYRRHRHREQRGQGELDQGPTARQARNQRRRAAKMGDRT